MKKAKSWVRAGILAGVGACLLGSPAFASDDLRAVPVDEIRKRAEAGEPAAQNRMGELYDGSAELGYDEAKMAQWFETAARSGHPEAQVSYASLYLYGRGRPQDMTQARIWYERAAEQGHHIGQFNTGIAYETGDGAPLELTTAYVWFALAAWTGTPDQAAQRMYDKKRDELKSRLPASDLATAERRIEAYKTRFADDRR